MTAAPLRHWSALLPLALALAGLALIFAHVVFAGGVREADEGASAHLWQLFMAAQLPLIAVFAITWLPRAPRPALVVLALLVAAVLANLAWVRSLGL